MFKPASLSQITSRHLKTGPRSRTLPLTTIGLVGLLLLATGCSSDESISRPTSSMIPASNFSASVDDEGLIVHKFDSNGDNQPDVIKYFQEAPDPYNAAVTKRFLRKVEIDANADGNVDIRRFYDDFGNVIREELDANLDGKIETINYYDGGALTRKELLNIKDNRVEATRYYLRGQLLRVEKDTNGDGKVDYWEYYEEGVLTRLGRDHTGDGRADIWQQR